MDLQATLKGEEKDRYLHSLDGALKALVPGLEEGRTSFAREQLNAFGEQNKWDFSRLAPEDAAYSELARLTERLRQEYGWFRWIVLPETKRNRGYFEEITVSRETGLPWQFDFIELHRLKKESAEMRAAMPSYSSMARGLKSLLMEDTVDLAEIAGRAEDIHKKAMKASFLEQLAQSELLGWESTEYSLKPHAVKIRSEGAETLWQVSFIRYSLPTSMFQIYVIDMWQDIREPQIADSGENAQVSAALEKTLLFGEQNAAWYILQTIDERFISLHPVHVSRLLAGPYENKYLTHPDGIEPLAITKELLKEYPNAALLRASIQYSFAPNHEPKGKDVRQVIHREPWHDEIIVAPAGYAARVSESVLGTNVKVVKS